MATRFTIIENEFGKLEAELFLDNLFLHLKLYKWSKNVYKVYKDFFETWLLEAKQMGFKKVYLIIPPEEKLIKFEKMFGFSFETNIGPLIVMSRST